MAIFHLTVKYISRGKGRMVVSAAAYRSGERLHDNYYGITHDFTGKRGIVYTMILLPENAPHKFYDRNTLWNAVEKVEKRKDSRLAREVELALPIELTLHEHIRLLNRYVTANFVERGMCADVAIHDKNDGNPHAHILLTTRNVHKGGFTEKNRDWDKRENTGVWRREWANIQNREFQRKGLDIRVSHESHINRGIAREPTKHLGYRVIELDHLGIQTDRSNENRSIEAINKSRKEWAYQRQIEIERDRNNGRDR